MVKVKGAIFTFLFLGLVYKLRMLRLFSLLRVFQNWTSPSGRFWMSSQGFKLNLLLFMLFLTDPLRLWSLSVNTNQPSSMTDSSRWSIWGCTWGPTTKSICPFGTISLSIISICNMWWSLTAGGYRRLKIIFFSAQQWTLWNHLGSLNIRGIGSEAVSGGRSAYSSLFCVRSSILPNSRREKFLWKCFGTSRAVGNMERKKKKKIQTKNPHLFPHPQNATLSQQRFIVSPNVFHLFRPSPLTSSAGRV